MYPVSFSDFPPSYLLNLPPPPLEMRSASAPASLSPFWGHVGNSQRPRLRALSVEDDDDDDLNIDTSNMTQEEKNELKAQRKLRKMNREKLKRSRVNDQFDHLCRVLHVGKTTRVEKLTVLNETLRTVYQLKAENKILKEQTRQMKELVVRRQNGEPVSSTLSALAQSQDEKSPLPPPPPLMASTRSATKERGRVMFDAPPPLEPLMELSIKEEAFFEQESPRVVKQEMMAIVGKQENVLPKQVPSEESVLSWNAMFEQPHHNDLDFAFGDSNFMWMKPPNQDGAPAFRIESECDFNPFVIPKPDHDCMDLFLTTSDECDLLC